MMFQILMFFVLSSLTLSASSQLIEHHHLKDSSHPDMILEPEESPSTAVAVAAAGDSLLVRPRLLFARSRYSSGNHGQSSDPSSDYTDDHIDQAYTDQPL
jgi:hypothetical protein